MRCGLAGCDAEVTSYWETPDGERAYRCAAHEYELVPQHAERHEYRLVPGEPAEQPHDYRIVPEADA
jgi:hypothetical protein